MDTNGDSAEETRRNQESQAAEEKGRDSWIKMDG